MTSRMVDSHTHLHLCQGAPADVFASANMDLPNQLYAKGACSKPVVFTRNSLVIIVPKANPASLRSVYDLAKPGVKLDIAGRYDPAVVGKDWLTVIDELSPRIP